MTYSKIWPLSGTNARADSKFYAEAAQRFYASNVDNAVKEGRFTQHEAALLKNTYVRIEVEEDPDEVWPDNVGENDLCLTAYQTDLAVLCIYRGVIVEGHGYVAGTWAADNDDACSHVLANYASSLLAEAYADLFGNVRQLSGGEDHGCPNRN